jgi:hypothetical protein
VAWVGSGTLVLQGDRKKGESSITALPFWHEENRCNARERERERERERGDELRRANAVQSPAQSTKEIEG